jgi:hypothetical protein
MELDDAINRVKQLITKREEIDAELAALFGGEAPKKRTLTCSLCNTEGHTARSCPTKQPAGS